MLMGLKTLERDDEWRHHLKAENLPGAPQLEGHYNLHSDREDSHDRED